MKTNKEKQANFFDVGKKIFGLKNRMQSPRLVKIVISSGVGSTKDKAKIELVQDRLSKITGQKAIPRPAKKSVATFKVRQGDTVGYQVTLRGNRMHDFVDKLIHVALPRAKDFRGMSRNSFDDIGNYTLGIQEHTVFPETSDEELRNIFGLSITFVTSTSSPEKALALFQHMGFPFKDEA